MSTSSLSGLVYRHVDVFSRSPLRGNGLTVFPDAARLDTATMQALTQEMRQFESIFLCPTDDAGVYVARIFTMEEELDFAGHPILGAAAVLHERLGQEDSARFELRLKAKTVRVDSRRKDGWYETSMDQGKPVLGEPIEGAIAARLLAALNLGPEHLAPGLPLQMVSTGLPYLILPLASGLEQVRVTTPSLEELLASVGAKFSYPLDVQTREGRSWDNLGMVEDIATGSAAGPAGAYLVRHGLAGAGEEIVIRQGRFCGRDSEISVRIEGNANTPIRAIVGGDVVLVARGSFD
ncbi:MAG: PhzF family phenazine biosynthesis protein [Proteobacteria bacterium]|nr:PhzF family phenazine biosynthesis protein [Pseudomonadota bacterium]